MGRFFAFGLKTAQDLTLGARRINRRGTPRYSAETLPQPTPSKQQNTAQEGYRGRLRNRGGRPGEVKALLDICPGYMNRHRRGAKQEQAPEAIAEGVGHVDKRYYGICGASLSF